VTGRWLVWAWVAPAQLLLLATLVGGLLLAIAPGRLGPPTRAVRIGRRLVTLTAVGLLLLGFLPTSHYLALPLATRFPVPRLPADVAGIILLAGSERQWLSDAYGEPQTGPHGSRYLTALRLAQRHPDARVVFTGGPRQVDWAGPLGTQTATAEAILGSVGLDPARLAVDDRSLDTCDHPGNVRAMVQPRPGETWVVVTSAMHMPRTVACFRAAGWPDVIPYPTDHQVSAVDWDASDFRIVRNLGLLDDAAHEWFGLAYYRLTGRIAELFPAP
jgi:uncharacterized SAM-binding protein YcdF (DUF218 family)